MASDKTGLIRVGLRLVSVLTIVILVVGAGRLKAVDPFAAYDLAMYQRPATASGDSRLSFPDGLVELWLRALDRPDAELQRLLIDTLAIAHKQGLEGLVQAKPRLLELLRQPGQRLDVLRSIAQTLVELDQRDQAETLRDLSAQHGLSIAQIVEPALARWKSPAMEKTWLERVQKAEAGQTMMILAADGLGQLGSADASQPLRALVKSSAYRVAVRMSAAQALGRIHQTGLVDFARQVASQPSRVGEVSPILAIEMLTRHEDPDAVELLTELVSHPATTVQSRALERLYEIDILLVDRHADKLLTSSDANVRKWCARAMLAKQDVARIGPLTQLLDDVNPSLRREVAAGLIELADRSRTHHSEIVDEILVRSMDVLNQSRWRGCEQACVVLARLDHKASGPRMVELLGHERGEVKVASAWGLTQLRIADLLPDMLDHAESVYDGFRSGQLDNGMPGVALQVAHLFVAFGDQRYKPAESVMRAYLPKNLWLGIDPRAAAAWSLGWFYENDPQDDLIAIMVQRLNDVGMDPERDEVRSMCAVALGRMKAESALGALRKHASGQRTCYWAIEQITGEPAPPVRILTQDVGGWFLAPVRE